MNGNRVCVIMMGLLLVVTASPALAQIITPPPETDWLNNRVAREDPRPLEIGQLVNRPTTDGVIETFIGEWDGATIFDVLDPSSGAPLGTLLAGVYDGSVFVGNDWTINTNQNPAFGGANAWRFGTALAQGPGNSGTGNWFEVLADATSGANQSRARWATSENDLQFADWGPASFFDIFTGVGFNGINWQFELEVDRNPTVDPTPDRPDPGPLPISYHWEWRQIDPLPGDGRWEPVYDGTIHTPEPSSLAALLSMAAVGLLLGRRRRKHTA